MMRTVSAVQCVKHNGPCSYSMLWIGVIPV